VNWSSIEQAPQTFNWYDLDAMIALAQKRGVDLLFTLGRTPRWASANPDARSPTGPGQCAPPAKIQYWEEFLRAVATHAAGKIKFWETWNEPQNPEFYCGDISTMVELQRTAYSIIKSIDPHAMILTPSPVNQAGPRWMSRFLDGGGGNYADIASFHGYLDPNSEAESIIEIIAKFKAVFAAHRQDNKPIWDTEAGWGLNSQLPNQDHQAAFLAKFYLLHWSAGIERFYWYAYDNSEWGTLWDDRNGLRKAGQAYGQVYDWLRGATMTAPCALVQSVWKCAFAHENGSQSLVVWTSGKELDISVRTLSSNTFRGYRDLDGNSHKVIGGQVPISASPIVLEPETASVH
jgi:hypothetical protein